MKGLSPLNRGNRSPRVLLVDDDRDLREGLARALMVQGKFEVALAEDSFEAGYAFARFDPHVVILDVVMDGMNGLDICNRIRHFTGSDGAKIIVLTGYAEAGARERSLIKGADVCLAKPPDVQQLILLIEELVGD